MIALFWSILKTALKKLVTRKMNPPVPHITVPLTPVDAIPVLGLIIDKKLTIEAILLYAASS